MSSGAAAPEQPSPSASESQPLSVEVFNGAARIQQIGPELFPGRYGGLSTGLDRPEDFLDIYLTEVRADDARAASEALGVPLEKIRLRRAVLTVEAARALQDRISDDWLSGRLDGVVEVAVERDGTVRIGLLDPGPDRVPDLEAKYGPGVIVTYGQTVIAAPRTPPAGQPGATGSVPVYVGPSGGDVEFSDFPRWTDGEGSAFRFLFGTCGVPVSARAVSATAIEIEVRGPGGLPCIAVAAFNVYEVETPAGLDHSQVIDVFLLDWLPGGYRPSWRLDPIR